MTGSAFAQLPARWRMKSSRLRPTGSVSTKSAAAKGSLWATLQLTLTRALRLAAPSGSEAIQSSAAWGSDCARPLAIWPAVFWNAAVPFGRRVESLTASWGFE